MSDLSDEIEILSTVEVYFVRIGKEERFLGNSIVRLYFRNGKPCPLNDNQLEYLRKKFDQKTTRRIYVKYKGKWIEKFSSYPAKRSWKWRWY